MQFCTVINKAWAAHARALAESLQAHEAGAQLAVLIVDPIDGFLDPADKTKFREGFSVPDDAPPAFFVVAHDDKSNPIEAAMLYLEYKKKNLAAELHIYTQGGHGFGMRRESHPINDWPQRVAEWMVAMGYAPKP